MNPISVLLYPLFFIHIVITNNHHLLKLYVCLFLEQKKSIKRGSKSETFQGCKPRNTKNFNHLLLLCIIYISCVIINIALLINIISGCISFPLFSFHLFTCLYLPIMVQKLSRTI